MSARVMLKRQATTNSARTVQGFDATRAGVIERALKVPGRPLDAATREHMEARLGHHFADLAVTPSAAARHEGGVVTAEDRTEREADAAAAGIGRGETLPSGAARVDFGRVRIHTDGAAQRSARALNALAFTVGREIFFDAGQYAPSTVMGQLLLAHELTHVLQARESSADVVIQRKEASKSLPIGDALKVALDGDDDATRDLTNNPDWEQVELNAPQSATLIIHLLDGITGDDDEIAGLKILRKDFDLKIFDDTLDSLNTRGRFGQLLDDYDGSEYRDLLSLLSNNISTQKMRARYLDEFITMFWVREHEERAIVYLLERTSDSDRAELLEPKFREERLRDAIDTDDVSVRYETVVYKAFGERAKKESKDKQRWTTVFDEEAKKCIRKGMGKAYRDDLLDRALKDMEREIGHEVLEYTSAVLNETIRPFGEPDAGKLAEINREFRKKMDGLLERKRAEFCMELKWGIEFNSHIDHVSGTAWTPADLAKMDEILADIPGEILHADPTFRAFEREKKRPGKPWLGGETSGNRISLLQGLSLSTTAHELGHVVHGADGQLLNDFEKISGWEELDEDALKKLRDGDKKNDKDFVPMIARLDDKRAKETGNTRAGVGEDYKDGFFYLYNRYGKGYFRYPSKLADGKKFVSDYAGTQPQDDFAETFAEYLTHPQILRGKPFSEKYKFMHVEVFVKFWLKQQFRAIEPELQKIFDDTLKKFPEKNAFVEKLKEGAVQELWDAFFKVRDDTIAARVAEAETTKYETPIPLKGSTQARDVTRVFVTEAQDLMALAAQIIPPHNQFLGVLATAFNNIPKAQEDAFKSLSDKLFSELETEMWAEFEPLAKRILKGEHIVKAKWAEVDAIAAQMVNVTQVIESYLDIYFRLIEARKDLFTTVHAELAKFPKGNPANESLRVFAVERLKRFGNQIDQVKTLVRAGTSFDPKIFGDPQAQMTQDKKDIQAFEKTLKP